MEEKLAVFSLSDKKGIGGGGGWREVGNEGVERGGRDDGRPSLCQPVVRRDK